MSGFSQMIAAERRRNSAIVAQDVRVAGVEPVARDDHDGVAAEQALAIAVHEVTQTEADAGSAGPGQVQLGQAAPLDRPPRAARPA